MPQGRRYVEPHVAVREVLERARRDGLEFDEAWDLAFGTRMRRGVKFPHATDERAAWKAALLAARGEFEAAYLRESTALSRALAAVDESGAGDSDGSVPAVHSGDRPVRLGYVVPVESITTAMRRRRVAA